MTTNMGRVVATLTPIPFIDTFFSTCAGAVHEHLGNGAVHTAVLHRCSIGQNTGALYRKRQPQVAQSLTEAAPSMRAAKLAPTASSMRTAAEATACSDTTQQVTPRMRAGGR